MRLDDDEAALLYQNYIFKVIITTKLLPLFVTNSTESLMNSAGEGPAVHTSRFQYCAPQEDTNIQYWDCD